MSAEAGGPDAARDPAAPDSPADPALALALWWRHANSGARQRARDADYYATSALSPDLVATFSRAGVAILDGHLVAPPGRRRGYYLDDAASAALREQDVDGPADRP